MSLADWIRQRDFAAVAVAYRERFGDDLTIETIECIQRIIAHPRAKQLGGTEASPWSDATWLMWFRNRKDDLAAKSCDQVLSQFIEEEVELPTDTQSWTEFLRIYSAEVLATHDIDLWSPIPEEARKSGWLGFPPADQRAIESHEERLEVTFPASLRGFYAVTNGWRTTGYKIYDVLPIEGLG